MTLSLAFSALALLDSVSRICVFLLMLSILVVLHELGHFVVARWNGVRVNDFAVGFGPTLLKWTSPRTGTNYRLNALPLGGYCAMQGEDGRTSEAEQQRKYLDTSAVRDDDFQGKAPWRRLGIVAAGPVANFLVALVILVGSAIAFGVPSDRTSTTIGPLIPNSPATRAGLSLGDRIVAIDGSPVPDGDAMVARIHASPDKPIRVAYVRHGKTREVTVTPMRRVVDGKTVGIIGFQTQRAYRHVSVAAAVATGASSFVNMIVGNATGLGNLVIHPHTALSQVSGPIGMERVSSQVQDLGWGPYLQLAAAISIALGIFNFLPIPALDGGRGIFILAEMLRGRPVDPEKEALVHVTGFALLMVLMVFVAYHDVATIVSGKDAL